MSTVKADTVQPKDFASDLTLGASGDTVTVAADSINVNKVQDKGGNTLWDYSTGEFVSTKKEFASQNLKLLSTAVASDTGSVSFTTIDSTYDVYIFKFINIHPTTNSRALRWQVSTDGGSTYATNVTSTFFRAYHVNNDSGAGLSYQTAYDLANSTSYLYLTHEMGNLSYQCGSGELQLFSPSSTTYVKNFISRVQAMMDGDTANQQSLDEYTGGYFNTTSAINAVSFKMTGGLFNGTIKMYGLL